MTSIINVTSGAYYDVPIHRPFPFGNPFVIGIDGTREEVIAKYKKWFKKQPHLMARLPSLKGKILGCYCKPLPCHGDAIVELIEEQNV